jgi:hypothetical protein
VGCIAHNHVMARRVIARAGLLVVCAVALASCGGEDSGGTVAQEPVSTTTTPATTTSTTRSGAIELGDAIALGDGVVVGVHPSKRIAYVSAIDHDTDEVGCEGGDIARLWAQPVDGGARVPALPAPRRSGTVVTGGEGGRVAVVEQCEGFLTTLVTAIPGDDGVLGDVDEVDTTAAQTDARLMPSTIRWSADGRSLLGLTQLHQEDVDVVHVVRLHLDGAVEDLGQGAALVAVAELADGRLVTASPGTLTVGEDEPEPVHVSSIAIAPDGVSIAVFGDEGVHVLVPGQPLRSVAPGQATVGSWSAAGDTLAFLRLDGDDVAVELARLDGSSTATVDDDGGFGPPLLTADGRTVLFNAAVDTGQGFDEPRAMVRPVLRT